jgi:hypothetical protein
MKYFCILLSIATARLGQMEGNFFIWKNAESFWNPAQCPHKL